MIQIWSLCRANLHLWYRLSIHQVSLLVRFKIITQSRSLSSALTRLSIRHLVLASVETPSAFIKKKNLIREDKTGPCLFPFRLKVKACVGLRKRAENLNAPPCGRTALRTGWQYIHFCCPWCWADLASAEVVFPCEFKTVSQKLNSGPRQYSNESLLISSPKNCF